MNLQGVVRIGPGRARAQQFGHAGFDVTAPVGILFAGGEIGQLAGDHGFHGHPGKLAVDARKGMDGAAELVALQGVLQAQFHGVLRHADGAGRRLDAGTFEGRHQLLETLAFLAAQKLARRDFETVEAKLVFLHAAVAEHLDLAAGHAGGGEGVVLRAARLFRQQHGKPLVSRLVRVGADQQRHQVRA